MTRISRSWGSYRVLDQGDQHTVKELVIDAGMSLSDQRHFNRSEHWYVVSGVVRVELEYQDNDRAAGTYYPGQSFNIPARTWHRATNIGTVPARVIETWLGDNLTETDIERRS